jgi:hypothetical protein
MSSATGAWVRTRKQAQRELLCERARRALLFQHGVLHAVNCWVVGKAEGMFTSATNADPDGPSLDPLGTLL